MHNMASVAETCIMQQCIYYGMVLETQRLAFVLINPIMQSSHSPTSCTRGNAASFSARRGNYVHKNFMYIIAPACAEACFNVYQVSMNDEIING